MIPASKPCAAGSLSSEGPAGTDSPVARAQPLGRVVAVVGLLALLAVMLFVALLQRVPGPEQGGTSWAWRRAHAISGDEPHYLVAVHSILFDRDLDLRDDYKAVDAGGWEAGSRFKGVLLDHHTQLRDPETGDREYWNRLFDVKRPDRSCHAEDCYSFHKVDSRFPDPSRVIERSTHPILQPVVLAALLAPTFPQAEQVEHRVAWIALAIAWLGCVLTYVVARNTGLGVVTSLLCSALLGLASPWLPYTRSFYGESMLGVVLLAGIWSMQRQRWAAAAALASALFWIKPHLVSVGAWWLLGRLRARRYRDAAMMAAIIGASGLALCAVNFWQVGTVVVGGNNRGWFRWSFDVMRPLVDSKYGLLPFSPWVLMVFPAMVAALDGTRSRSVHLLELMAVPTAFHAVVLAQHFPSYGSCYGSRYWVQFLPWLAIVTVAFTAERSRRVRVLTIVLAVLGALIAVPAALQLAHSWNVTAFEPLRTLLR